jgi:twitching motility protein PilT
MDDEFLKSLVAQGVSDIHLKVGRPPLRRFLGMLIPSDLPQLTEDQIEHLARHLVGDKIWNTFEGDPQIETSHEVKGIARFRVSLFRQRGMYSMVLRIIPFEIPTLEQLRVPDVVKKFCDFRHGLILVTGMTGSGKSSTLAAMVHRINQSCPYHIITIEDPIEFNHRDLKSSVNQREVGQDTSDYATAFRSSLRQDPDVILVGELRDRVTMEIALRAAETGHLVLSTLHTTDAKETIGRVIDMFPPHQQGHVRKQLGANLRAVISQRLLLRADTKSLVLAAEVMVVNAAVRDLINNPGTNDDYIEHIEKGKSQYGSRSFDQSILELLDQKLITEDEALNYVTNANDFRLKLNLR